MTCVRPTTKLLEGRDLEDRSFVAMYRSGLMHCPSTGPKMFCASPNLLTLHMHCPSTGPKMLCGSKNLNPYNVSSKTLCQHKN